MELRSRRPFRYSVGCGWPAIQEGAHDAGSVDLDLCALSQLAVVPFFLCQSGHGGSCLADAPVELCV